MPQKTTGKKPIKKVTAKRAVAAAAPAAVRPAKKAVKQVAPPPSPSASKSKPVEKLLNSQPRRATTHAAAIAEPPKEARKEKIVPLTRSDLQYFRNLLLEKRREIIGDVGSMESEAFKGGSNLSNMPIHMADVGTDNFEQEFTLGLIETERQTLREIQEALIRIEDGTYGICQGTGKSIPRVRLEAMPWAKYTIEYKRLLDQGKIARDNAQSSDDDSGSDDDED